MKAIETHKDDALFKHVYDYDAQTPDGNDADDVEAGISREEGEDAADSRAIPAETDETERRDAQSGSDPLYIYYRSMCKIPLLTREQEVELAKRIENARNNIIRLLALTPISSANLMERSADLQPAPALRKPFASDREEAGRNDGSDTSPEERKRLRKRQVQRILNRLDQIEKRYSRVKLQMPREGARSHTRKRKIEEIRNCRENAFRTISRIGMSDALISQLVCSLQEALKQMEWSEKTNTGASRRRAAMRMSGTKARLRSRSIHNGHLTSARELREILELIYENKGEMARAKDEFVRANLRLVISIARNYSHPGLDLMDLVQEGNIGLMKAVDKFDYRLGLKFSTYASWWIRQSISRALADQGSTIRKPVHVVEAMYRIRRTSNELKKKIGREPSAQEVASALRAPLPKVVHVLKASQEPISLEAAISDSPDCNLKKFIGDANASSPDEDVIRENLQQATEAALNALTPRQREVLRMRYGLNEMKREHTLQEIGEAFQVTRERIRQIEEKALQMLRTTYRSRKLQDFAAFSGPVSGQGNG